MRKLLSERIDSLRMDLAESVKGLKSDIENNQGNIEKLQQEIRRLDSLIQSESERSIAYRTKNDKKVIVEIVNGLIGIAVGAVAILI